MRKLVSLAVALMLAMAPASASSEMAARSGSFTLRFSDPKFVIVQGDERIEQDLQGLSVQLGGVRDASDPDLHNLLLSLMILANDDPALSAMLGLKGEQAYALVSGITGVLVMPADQALMLVGGRGLAPALGVGPSAAVIEGIRFVESAPEPVQFISSSGDYPRHSASLDSAQLRALLGDLDMLEDMSCDISYFTDGADNLRVEATLYIISDGEPANANLVFTVESRPDGTLNAEGSASSGSAKLALTLSGAPDADYPDHYALDGRLDFEGNGGSSTNDQITFSLFPTEAQDGVPSDLLSIALSQDGQPAFQLNAVSRVTPQEESYSLVLSDAFGGAQYALSYDGVIARAASQTHTGTLRLETSGAEPTVSGELQLRLVLSDSTEGKLPDISGFAPIDLLNPSEADQQRLASEVQQLQLTMLGKLMSLPSLARIIAQAISGGGFELGGNLLG